MDILLALVTTITITINEQRTIQQTRPQGEIHQEYTRQDATVPTTFKGYVSNYSANLGSCLGCTTYWDSQGQPYWITASGERLDNNSYTIAANFGTLGDNVSVCNLDNGKCIGARINDRGGFDTPQYNNRIADLMPLVTNAINAKTDTSLIEITIL